MKRPAALLLVLLLSCAAMAQSQERLLRSRIVNYFANYVSDTDIREVSVLKTTIAPKEKTITIRLSDNFSRQLFREQTVDTIYSALAKLIPDNYSNYIIKVVSNGRPIEELVPNKYKEYADQDLFWNITEKTQAPWVSNESRSFTPVHGLDGVHLSITPSHGLYFSNEDTLWTWQRPPLFCTREDLLTQSFIYPFLIPMLENAGAIAIPMRERDWQTNSVTVDDTDRRSHFKKSAPRGSKWNSVKTDAYSRAVAGFSDDGTASVSTIATAQGSSHKYATASWIPEIPADGRYAVYVSYASFGNSVPDARYTVYHKGGHTVFRVNQRIGSGTWVYLGTFDFGKGDDACLVTLDNESSFEGIVTADAVRFGGGMSDIERMAVPSGAARYLEGSRYYADFAGAPDSVFMKYDGNDDYSEDIQSRPRLTNWLSGGSEYNPGCGGQKVPIELSFALHTDAGFRHGDSIVGSLGICTTMLKDSILGTGLSRMVSRDLTDMVLTELSRDLSSSCSRDWTIRGIADANYCESREPQMPSTLLELLSHQNFYDLKYAFEPEFRFLASRSMYKAILKYTAFMHGWSYTVQPLPVSHFAITESKAGGPLHLSWQPVADPMEPSARADGYILYTRIDDGAFDNGMPIKRPYYDFIPKPGHIYSFKVTAVNSGGQSFPSETLAAYRAPDSRASVLIVNGFQRVGGPATIDTPEEQGFDLQADPGVQYLESPIYCGFQQCFDKDSIGIENENGLGWSNDTLAGTILKGNSFDYPYLHGKAIAAAGKYSFVSCSREAIEDSIVSMSGFDVVDLILGLQKSSPSDTIMHRDYSCFTPALSNMITDYLNDGGRLLASGSFIGQDLARSDSGIDFARDVLKISWKGSVEAGSENSVSGLGYKFGLAVSHSDNVYQLLHPDIIEPMGDAISIFAYTTSRFCSGVAWNNGKGAAATLGFPFESIKEEKMRADAMASLLEYLLDK